MNEALIRLRKLAAESADTGTPADRDQLIRLFLAETTAVICEDAVNQLTDSRLRYCYYQWTKAINAGADETDRILWLTTGVDFFPEAYTPAKQETLPENVVHLVRR